MWAASARLQHFAASRRRQEASIRIALRSLLLEKVDELGKGIEADDLRAISDEIGKRIDVVKVEFAIAVIDDILDAADLNARGVHDAFHLLNDFVRRRVALHAQAGLGCINGAGSARQLLAAGGAADVGWAKVKGFSREMDLDAVQEFSAEHFHANDVSATSGDELLHQRG